MMKNDILSALQKRLHKLRKEAPRDVNESMEKEWFSKIEAAKKNLNTAVDWHLRVLHEKEKSNEKVQPVSTDEMVLGLSTTNKKKSRRTSKSSDEQS